MNFDQNLGEKKGTLSRLIKVVGAKKKVWADVGGVVGGKKKCPQKKCRREEKKIWAQRSVSLN